MSTMKANTIAVHLDGDFIVFDELQGIELLYEELYSYPFSVFANELFVAIRFLTTQMKIAVGKGDVVAFTP